MFVLVKRKYIFKTIFVGNHCQLVCMYRRAMYACTNGKVISTESTDGIGTSVIDVCSEQKKQETSAKRCI